jgi:hypothetical protein
MTFLRVMTFNMQLLPQISTPIFDVQLMPTAGNESEERASLIGDAIAAMPDEERPDVLIGNEVFHEGGRNALHQRLKGFYPVIFPFFEDPLWVASLQVLNPIAASLFEDSGLFFASKFPALSMPDGNNFRFKRYVAATGIDAFSAKGVGIVSLETPIGLVTLAFTHTQAFTDHEEENKAVRKDQLVELQAELTAVVGPPPAGWQNVIILGDLNIRGDFNATGSEWAETFGSASTVFATTLTDAWRSFMRPPDSTVEKDPGFTNNNLVPGKNGALPVGTMTRLDYMVTPRFATGNDVVPQHMRTRFRALSDHWSLEADFHRGTPNCTPATALDIASKTTSVTSFTSGLQVVNLSIENEGSYQWVYVKTPGTYSLFQSTPEIEVALFQETDLSNAWNPYDSADASTMELEDLPSQLTRSGLEPRARQFELPGPFFVRVRAREKNGGFTGNCRIGILRHRGESPALAIVLRPWADLLDPELPPGQPLGRHDECWFRARLDWPVSAEAYSSLFQVLNNTGAHAAVELLTPKSTMLDDFDLIVDTSGAGTPLELTHSPVGEQVVYLKLRRSDLNQVDFRVGFKPNLTYLRPVHMVRPFVLRCLDETGPDWMGADEITFKMRFDSMLPFSLEKYWNDADAEEILKLESDAGPDPVPFVSKIEVWLNEADFIKSQFSITSIPALTPFEPITKAISHHIDIQSGTYRLEGMLSRWRDG